MQTPHAHPHAIAIPAHHLDAGMAAVAEDVGDAVARGTTQQLLDVQRQPVDAGADVDRLRRQPDCVGLQSQQRQQPLRSLPAGIRMTIRSWSEHCRLDDLGGVAEIEISKTNGTILRVTHGK